MCPSAKTYDKQYITNQLQLTQCALVTALLLVVERVPLLHRVELFRIHPSYKTLVGVVLVLARQLRLQLRHLFHVWIIFEFFWNSLKLPLARPLHVARVTISSSSRTDSWSKNRASPTHTGLGSPRITCMCRRLCRSTTCTDTAGLSSP